MTKLPIYSYFQYFINSYFTDCWDISKGKILQEFTEWGRVFSIQFEITVTNIPSGQYANVFQFSSRKLNWPFYRHGDNKPGFYINKAGSFHFSSAVSGKNHYHDVDLELGKLYQITIQQLNVGGKYWYEIIIDGETKLKIENTCPHFSNAILFTSNTMYNEKAFSTDMGRICNVKIKRGFHGKLSLHYNTSAVKTAAISSHFWNKWINDTESTTTATRRRRAAENWSTTSTTTATNDITSIGKFSVLATLTQPILNSKGNRYITLN